VLNYDLILGKKCQKSGERVFGLSKSGLFGLIVRMFCLSLLLTGCWTWKPDVPGEGEGFGRQAVYVEPGEPTIKPGLVLKVSVSNSGSGVKEELKEVNANGEILMDLIGAVKCEGLTLVALQEKIKESLKEYYLDPQVTISFMYQEGSAMKSPWGTVLVMGQVARPGPVNVPSTGDLTVIRALMMAGNVTQLADKKRVIVWRREKNGDLKKIRVDIDLIGKEGRTDLDVLMKPGDVVWVPESWY